MAELNLCDYHIHTRYSSDSTEEPENIIRHAIELGLDEICFTDHTDLDYPETPDYENPAFVFDTVAYYKEISELRNKYSGKIKIKIGVELGLMPYLAARNEAVASGVPFDFIIGSTHLIDGKDPYYPEFWEGYSCDDVVALYFEKTLENIKSYNNYDVYGHLDYITRYAPDKAYQFDYRRHSEIIDCILKEIIHTGHGIEINTSCFRYELPDLTPSRRIISLYKDLGGEIITTGSDAHCPSFITCKFDYIQSYLKDMGFKYICTFDNLKPNFIKL